MQGLQLRPSRAPVPAPYRPRRAPQRRRKSWRWASPVLAIAYDAGVGANSATNASSLSYSHTVGTLSNGVLIVTVGYYNRARSVTALTYNGVAMTLYLRYEDGVRAATQEIWRLVNPASGSNTVAITMDAAVGAGNIIWSEAASYSGVDQTTPIEATNAKSVTTGSHSTHSDALTPANNGAMVVDTLLCGGTGTPSATGSGQTARVAAADAGSATAHGFGETGPVNPAASTTMSWSFSSGTTASNHIVFALKPAGGTAFTSTLTGATAPTGAPIKATSAPKSGASTPSGAPLKSCGKPSSGAVTSAGAPLKSVAKAAAGTWASAGALLKAVSKIAAGATAPSGVIVKVKVVLLALAGAFTPSGSIAKLVRQALSGVLAWAGDLLLPGSSNPVRITDTSRARYQVTDSSRARYSTADDSTPRYEVS
jgi:hypothetical protein